MVQKDAIIIGSGQAGKPLSLKLSRAGWNVALIERSEEQLGGTCINTGCTPTKTLIASAQRIHDMHSTNGLGVSCPDARLDYDKVQKRKENVVNRFRESFEHSALETENLDLIYGHAFFREKKNIQVDKPNGSSEQYVAPYVFINAGSRPRIPDIPGLSGVDWLDSTSILQLEKVPTTLIIAGGGYIGLELGQMFLRLGSKVTLIETADQILPKEDKDVASSIREILEKEGMKIITGSSIEHVGQQAQEITVTIRTQSKTKTLNGAQFLLATGRTSNADELHVSEVGIALDDKGFIRVNDKLQTNIKNIYALGDINGGPRFTHIAYNDYLIVYENLVKKKNASIKDRIVPYCMYTDPQLGRVGLSEKEARSEGMDITVVKIPGSSVTRGIETGKIQGLWKAIVDNRTNNILGAAIVCTEGGEVASVIQMAMAGGLTASYLAKAIFSHPSYAESINTLFMNSGT